MCHNMQIKNKYFVIAGGGTGGHIYPGLAIADKWNERHGGWDILFAGTARGLEKDIVPRAGYKLKLFLGMGIMGNSVVIKIKGIFLAGIGFLQSFLFFLKRRPSFVVGVGGYASGAPMVAAVILGIPTLIHEENAVLGMTNRLLWRRVKEVTHSFETTLEETKGKGTVTGNPVRIKLSEVENDIPSKFNILVVGGSRGAESINRLMLNILPLLEWKKDEIMIIHQTGRGKLGRLAEKYRAYGFKADVREYIYDMAKAFSWAHVVISRAGATTLAELAAMGKASILIPFPQSAGNHQMRNAETMVKAGAARMFTEDSINKKDFANLLIELVDDRERVAEMSKNAHKIGIPDATDKIVNILEEMIGLK